MGIDYATSDSWVVVTSDGTIVTASKTEQGVRARWEADVDGTTVKPTPSEVDEFAFVWGAVVPGTGVVGIDSDPDLVAQMADDRGGWVSLIRVHPGPRVFTSGANECRRFI